MNENMVNSFTFYRDYFNLLDTLSIEDKKELAVAILDYIFKDIIPNLDGHNLAIFNTLSHQLSKSKSQSKRRTKPKPKKNQKKTKKEPNKNKTSILSFKFYISNFKFIEDNNLLKDKIIEWLDYKEERKELYKETGFKSLVTQINNNVKKYGAENVINLITECMANNYKGIIFEKLKNCKKPAPTVERRIF